HELRLEKTGCAPLTRTVIVEEGKTAEVSVELAIGRGVTLRSDPAGADLYVDGTRVGTAPYAATLSFGTHRVKAEKEGVVKEETISVSEHGQSEWTLSVRKVPQTETITVNGVSFKMVAVQGGTFTMGCTSEQGSDCYSDEKPAHRVTVSDFSIGETEVTQALWKAVMGTKPSDFKGDDLPVEKVSWDDCQKFIKKLNELTGKTFRLPTEAEWEYAARGGNKSKGYKYSGSNTLGSVAWYDDNSGSKTHPVKTKAANELGLYDMSGNVWEWCSDWYGDYSSGSQTNPVGASSGSDRVLRGGSWSYTAWHCRVSNRKYSSPEYCISKYGFRLVIVH
ncbi:MAG: SUMF1/EgtB/PvdO family nonheme iron enzyme, partial [Bacteroidales bacterium]|nr:SUMF1/EgtB/PvdO family nonheme iron enzyme [Bacteroidales bacterium]